MALTQPLLVMIMTISSVFAELPWSYDKVSLWGTMGTGNKSLFSEYQIKFVAENWNMVYIHKCLGGVKNATEEQYYNTSTYLRKYASSDKLQVLMYFATDEAYCDCYASLEPFCTNQSMWFRDDYGNIVYNGGNPLYDHTQKYVQEWYANTIANVMRVGIVDRNLSINGFFGDGMTKNMSMIYKNVSNRRANEWINGVKSAMNLTKKLFNEINDEIYIIGNAITTYSDNAPLYGSEVLPYVDGVAHCHYAEYEVRL